MIDMVKRDVDARLQAMIAAERHRARIREEARRNPVCRVRLLPKRPAQSFEQIEVNGRILTVIDGRIYSR